jgi:hypothetical protein
VQIKVVLMPLGPMSFWMVQRQDQKLGEMPKQRMISRSRLLDLDAGQPATQSARSGEVSSAKVYKISSSFCRLCIRSGAAYPADVDVTESVSAHKVRAKQAINAPLIGGAATLIMQESLPLATR